MLPAPAVQDRLASHDKASTSQVVERLKQRWPCREQLIDQLAQRLSCTGSSQAPVFVFGPPATGKTAVVRDVFRELGVRHAYVNCQEVARAKPLLSAILHQLKGAKRRRDEGYDCGVKCESLAEFVHALPAVVGRRSASAGAAWVVVDNAQRIAGSELLTGLMKMRGSMGANVGLLLISGVAWASGRFLRDTANVADPATLFVPPYRPDQLVKVLEQRRAAEQGGKAGGDALAYRQFLQLFVPAFCRASNNLLDLQAAVALLYPRYKAHQLELAQQGRQPQAAELFRHIKRDVQHVVSQLDLHERGLLARRRAEESGGAGSAGAAASGGAAPAAGLSFELPYVSKFLLMAAYIASHNKPTTDRQVFDPGYKKRGGRNAQAMDRAAEAAVEARLHGPHTFPLERLLHIFYVLYQGEGAREGEEGGEGDDEEEGAGAARRRGVAREARREMQQGEVLMQLATLVSLRLLSQTSGDALEGGLYRCNLSQEMADAIARNIKLSLQHYLKLG